MLLFLILLQWLSCAGSTWCFVSAVAWTWFMVQRYSKQLLSLLVLIAGVGTVFSASALAFSFFVLVQLLTGLNVIGSNFAAGDSPQSRIWTIFDWILFAVYVVLSFYTSFAIFAAVAFSPPIGDGGRERLVDLRGKPVRWMLALAAFIGAFVSATSTTEWIASSVLLVTEIFSAVSDVSFRRPRGNADG